MGRAVTSHRTSRPVATSRTSRDQTVGSSRSTDGTGVRASRPAEYCVRARDKVSWAASRTTGNISPVAKSSLKNRNVCARQPMKASTRQELGDARKNNVFVWIVPLNHSPFNLVWDSRLREDCKGDSFPSQASHSPFRSLNSCLGSDRWLPWSLFLLHGAKPLQQPMGSTCMRNAGLPRPRPKQPSCSFTDTPSTPGGTTR